MDIQVINAIDFGFTWLIVLLSVIGYAMTVKRTGQRWSFWILLAFGWAFLAIPCTLRLAGISMESEASIIWMCSYIMIMASLAMIFLKFVDILKHKKK
jgi:hypothetical protein